MSEKRAYERLTLDGDVYIKTKGRNAHAFRAFLHDVSFGGFAMYSQEKLKPGNSIEFNLVTQPVGQGLAGKGKIRHSTCPPQYNTPLNIVGVEFVEVNKDLVTYIINRLQAKSALAAQAKKVTAGSLDFIPF